MLTRFLQWLVNVDEESFFALPVWMRPTSVQLAIEHPLSADFIVW